MTDQTLTIRSFKNMPDRMKKLPVNDKGFPVPYFVTWIDGQPDFRVITREKIYKALKHNKCWICGEKLGKFKAFIIGPMCGITRTISDPPSHKDCTTFAALNCPFLANPNAKRIARGLPEGSSFSESGILRNPGASGVWATTSFRPFKANDGILFDIGEPHSIEWYANGRAATIEEVKNSVSTGMHFLEESAAAEGVHATAELQRRAIQFSELINDCFARDRR